MQNIYITQKGDQWDMIAKKVYGSEIYMSYLLDNNIQYIDIFEFEAGIELYTPELTDDQAAENLPYWR